MFLALKTKKAFYKSFSNHSLIAFSALLAHNKSITMVAVVASAEKPLSTIILIYSTALDCSSRCSNPWIIVLYETLSGKQPFPSIFSNSSQASFIRPSLHSPLNITV
ncbi:hypothetical protein CIPAW_08G120400 [Carya illinoinensis]|uniref:Uncharacterized protein n=1 Tax=Carya illinoinensis TaxID=32201 RepID=A0A8T1PUC1_CARIL|nr:hypothetical protein CIPAW_08G120400 [Carya illinoinensis]